MPNETNQAGRVPIPALPGDPMVRAANVLLEDPAVREQVRQMHKSGRPLMKMVEDLGLDEDMDPALGKVIEDLSPEVVQSIRQATLEMLDRADDYALPLDCNVQSEDLKSPRGVHVTVEEEHGIKTIHVRGPQGRAAT